MSERVARIARTTKETDIDLSVGLDGTGETDVETGIGFFDHMLTAFGRHGLFDLQVRCKGDLEVDGHHSVEDTGIVMGQALAEAVGDKAGISRFGNFMLPAAPPPAAVASATAPCPWTRPASWRLWTSRGAASCTGTPMCLR